MSILLPSSCITLGGRTAVFLTHICWEPQENCLLQALFDPFLPEFLQGLQKMIVSLWPICSHPKKNLCKFVKTTATENLAGLYCHRTIPHLRRSPEFSHQPELRISWENPIRVLLLSFYVAIIARAIATVASAFFLFGFLSLSFSLFLRGLREKNEKNAWQHYWWKKSCMVETLQTIRINWCKDLSINSRSANSSTKQTSSSSQLPSNSGTRVGSMSATNCSTKSCFFRSHRYLNERHPVTLIIQRFNLQNALGTPI